VNIGVLLFDPETGRVLRRLVEEPSELARVRRLHPAVDENLIRGLAEEFDAQISAPGKTPLEQIGRLQDTLSNSVQFGPQKGLLTEDFEAELDRLYRDQVEPPRYRRDLEDLSTRNAIRTRANQVFRSAGIWPKLERRIRVDQFTYEGDPMRLDYFYRRNGTYGYIQTLALGRDPGQAKVLAFTAEAIRAKVPKTDFLAVTESEPRPSENPRHRFVNGLLQDHSIHVLPLNRLMDWAQKMRPALLTNGH
jgi:hypothetical protein